MKYFSLTVAIIAFILSLGFTAGAIIAFINLDLSTGVISITLAAISFAVFYKFAKEYKDGVEEVDIS